MTLLRLVSGLKLRDDFTSDTEANYTRSGNDNWSVSGGLLNYSTASYNSGLRREYTDVKCATVRAKSQTKFGWTSHVMVGGLGENHVNDLPDGYSLQSIDSDDMRIIKTVNGADAYVASDTPCTRSLGTYYYYRIYIYNGVVYGKWGATGLSNALSGASTTFTQGQIGIWCNADKGAAWDFIEARTSQLVTVTELPTGYWVVISDGTTTAKAQESSGTAIVNGGAVLFPLASISIYNGDPDAGGNLVVELTSSQIADMGGGDWFEYSVGPQFTVDAIILDEASETREVTFTADLMVKITDDKTFTVDANIHDRKVEITADIRIIELEKTKTFTADAYIVVSGVTLRTAVAPGPCANHHSLYLPSIARDSNNRLHCSYIGTDTQTVYYCYSDDEGDTWTTPVAVDRVDAHQASSYGYSNQIVCTDERVVILTNTYKSDLYSVLINSKTLTGTVWSSLWQGESTPDEFMSFFKGYSQADGDIIIGYNGAHYQSNFYRIWNYDTNTYDVRVEAGNPGRINGVVHQLVTNGTTVWIIGLNGSTYTLNVTIADKTAYMVDDEFSSVYEAVLGPDGNCWIFTSPIEQNGIYLRKINADNNLVATATTIVTGTNIFVMGTHYDAAGNLYLMYYNNGSIYIKKYNTSGTLVDTKLVCANFLGRSMYQKNSNYNSEVMEVSFRPNVGTNYGIGYGAFDLFEIFKTITDKTVTTDAFISGREEKTFTTDITIIEQYEETLTVDGLISAREEKTFTADALIRDTFEETISADGRILVITDEEFTTDADVVIPAHITSIDVSSGPTIGGTVVTVYCDFLIDLNSYIPYIDGVPVEFPMFNRFTDSFIFSTPGHSSGEVQITLRSIRGTWADNSVTFTYVPLEKEFSTDIHIREESNDIEFTADVLVAQTEEKELIVDSYIFATNETSFTVNGRVKLINEKLFGAYTYIKDTSGSEFTADAVVVERFEEEFTVDIGVRDTKIKSVTIDARIKEILDKTVTVDSRVKEILDVNFTVDISVAERIDKEFTADSRVKEILTETVSVDARIKQIVDKTFTLDVYSVDRRYEEFTVDSIVKEILTKTFTVDSRVKVIVDLPFEVDMVIRFDEQPELAPGVEWVEINGKAAWMEMEISAEWIEIIGKTEWVEINGTTQYIEILGKCEPEG